jgi:muramoyltetrapeptide carboxypeptidase
LKKLSPKLIIGFSDISALHSAFLAQLAWPGLHAPMPATSYWSENQDIDLTALMETFINPQNPIILNIYETISHPSLSSPIHGWLFGGCLSVLTNLIGTPYFPENLNRAILFWEDIDESPARILRQVNHWIQSKVLLGVQAIILGRFTLSQSRPDLDTRKLGTEIFLRTSIPVFLTQEFGHCSPNIPLLLGGQAQINRSSLSWTRRRPHGTLST